MSEFNEDDVDIEDEADGEHMAQIYSKDSIKDHIRSEGTLQSYVNLKNEQIKQNRFLAGGMLNSNATIVNENTTIPGDYDPYLLATLAKSQQSKDKSKVNLRL